MVPSPSGSQEARAKQDSSQKVLLAEKHASGRACSVQRQGWRRGWFKVLGGGSRLLPPAGQRREAGRGAGGRRLHRPEESAERAAPLARRGPGPRRTRRGWSSERREWAARGSGWDAAGRPPEHPGWPVARRPAGATRGCSWAGTRCGRRPRYWSPPCCWAPRSASASASASGSAAAPPARVRRTRWVGRAGNRGMGRGDAVFLGPVVRVSIPLL